MEFVIHETGDGGGGGPPGGGGGRGRLVREDNVEGEEESESECSSSVTPVVSVVSNNTSTDEIDINVMENRESAETEKVKNRSNGGADMN